jgi:transposase
MGIDCLRTDPPVGYTTATACGVLPPVSDHATQYQQLIDREIIKVLSALPLVVPILQTLGLRGIVAEHLVGVNDVDNGTVALILCLNRLVAPRPLYKVEEWLADTIVPAYLGVAAAKLHDDRLGRFLDDLAPHIEPIWQALCLRAVQHYHVDLAVILYDLTSFYFEGNCADNAAVTYGYSRDHRSDTKQRVVGLNVTGTTGVPLVYSLLAGNTADGTTPDGNLTRLRGFLDRLPEPPRWSHLVSDRALISAAMLVRAYRQEIHLLGPLDDRQEAHRQIVREVAAADLRQHPLPYRPQRSKPTDPIPYYGIARPTTFEAVMDGETVSVPGQILVVLSASKERLDREHRQADVARLEEALAGIAAKLNQRKYKQRDYVVQRLAAVQRGNPAKRLVDLELAEQDGQLVLRYGSNAAKLAQEEALDGKYLLGTTDRALSPAAFFAQSKRRDGIEKRIGLLKGPLRVRPVDVQTEPRIQGLVFLTLVALLVFSLLELQLRRAHQPQTARAVVEEFGSLRAVDLVFQDGSRLRRVGELTALQSQILAALDFPPIHTYLTVHEFTC